MFSKKILFPMAAIAMASFVACGDDSSSGASDSNVAPASIPTFMDIDKYECSATVNKCAKIYIEDKNDTMQCDGVNAWRSLITGPLAACETAPAADTPADPAAETPADPAAETPADPPLKPRLIRPLKPRLIRPLKPRLIRKLAPLVRLLATRCTAPRKAPVSKAPPLQQTTAPLKVANLWMPAPPVAMHAICLNRA